MKFQYLSILLEIRYFGIESRLEPHDENQVERFFFRGKDTLLIHYIKMILSVTANVTRNTTINLQKKKTSSESELLIFNALCSLFTCLALVIACGGIHPVSAFTLLLSVIYGAALVTAYQTLILAMKEGPMSYTILIATCGMIIPTLFGTIVYREPVTVFQLIGFILMPVGFYFGANPKKSDKINAKWVKYVFLCFFASGIQGVLQKVMIRSVYSDENGMFLLSAFFLSAVLLTVMYFINKDKAKEGKDFAKKYYTSVIVGIADAFQHKVNTVLSGVLPSMICYPVINGGGIAGATIVSVLVFKEKLDKMQRLGFLLCVVSIILMCIV